MYQDIYLAFTDEAAANAVLFTQEPTEWDTTDPEAPVATAWEPKPNFANISTIGIIYKPTGETLQGEDGEGNVVSSPEMAPVPGWHVNVRLVDGEDGAALEPFAVEPVTPVRVWG